VWPGWGQPVFLVKSSLYMRVLQSRNPALGMGTRETVIQADKGADSSEDVH
jgi:hypothetical protein